MAICGSKSLEEQICYEDFTNVNKTEVEQQPHEESRLFKCNQCERIFNKKSSIVCHMRLHTGEKPFACTQCNSRFTHKSTLLHHSRLHTGEKPYECEICHKRFRQRPNYSVHKKTHTKEKLFECEFCGKRFTQRVHLTTHRRLHTGEKPFVCKECNRKFSQQCHLTRHQSIHKVDKVHKCNVCDKRFSCNAYLNTHLRIHTGEKLQYSKKRDRNSLKKSAFYSLVKYDEFSHDSLNTNSVKRKKQDSLECEFCHKRCIKKSHLRHHIFVHTGEKPYECKKCGKKFSERGSLTRHMKVHDGICPSSGLNLGGSVNRKELSKCEVERHEILEKYRNDAKPDAGCLKTDHYMVCIESSNLVKTNDIPEESIPVPAKGIKNFSSILLKNMHSESVIKEHSVWQQFCKDSKVVSDIRSDHQQLQTDTQGELTDNVLKVKSLKQASITQVRHSVQGQGLINFLEVKEEAGFVDTPDTMHNVGMVLKHCHQLRKHPFSSKFSINNKQCDNGILPLEHLEEDKGQHMYVCTFVSSSESLPLETSVASSETLPSVNSLYSCKSSHLEHEPIRPHHISAQYQTVARQETGVAVASGQTKENGQEITLGYQSSAGRPACDRSSSSEVAVSFLLFGQQVKEENTNFEGSIKQEVDVVDEALDSPLSLPL